ETIATVGGGQPTAKPAAPAVPSIDATRPIGGRQDGTFSIIGNDLTIVGQGLRIITRGTLQVEGKIEGDVVGNEVIIGEKGQVTGVVSGQHVIVHGSVAGTVKGVSVVLKSGARVDGDVLHQQLSVEQGAYLDGRVRRPADPAELTPVLE
ncbi:MAG: polymer-forming cytoskeletal protein, partial [Hyphomicrobiaceae bacterium]